MIVQIKLRWKRSSMIEFDFKFATTLAARALARLAAAGSMALVDRKGEDIGWQFDTS